MTSIFREEDAQLLRFGGGQNSRASEEQIHDLECSSGKNFLLDPGNDEYRPRPAFDLIGTVPNGAEIRGFATLKRTDGAVSMLVQAGGVVYEWDGAATFTSRGSVAATAKMRGRREAFWALADKVLIADVNLADEIHEWDGTTLAQTSFVESDGSTAFPSFRCKYILVDNERAIYANVHDNGTNFPHLMVSSEQGTYTIVVDSGYDPQFRPEPSRVGGSARTITDTWWLPLPQFRAINGFARIQNIIAISQEGGAIEKLIGQDTTDFELNKFHIDSGAAGDESLVGTNGDDVIYGAAGRIESLIDTNRSGDTESNDVSFKIQPDVTGFTSWTLEYNKRLKRVYCFPSGQNEVWVLFTEFIGSDLSPWVKWTTKHPMNFQPTALMSCLDPADGLEYVFMGDGSGNVFRMEGTGTSGDGGTSSIVTERTSKIFSAPLDGRMFNINGWIQQRKKNANDYTLRAIFHGENAHDTIVTDSLSAVSFDTVYNGGDVFYNGGFYYGIAQQDRFVRRKYDIPGSSNQVQFSLEIDGVNDFSISEQGIRFDASD